jgi:hypothetical protein
MDWRPRSEVPARFDKGGLTEVDADPTRLAQ